MIVNDKNVHYLIVRLFRLVKTSNLNVPMDPTCLKTALRIHYPLTLFGVCNVQCVEFRRRVNMSHERRLVARFTFRQTHSQLT